MRAIKFRAWDKTHKKMLDRVLAGPGDPCSIVWDEIGHEWLNFDESCGTIMQYTGLTDDNGKEIYESDIALDHKHIDLKTIVKWRDGKGEWLGSEVGWVLNNGYYTTEFETCTKSPYEHEEIVNVTILGNIYENPELLKDMGSFGYDPITGKR